MQRYIAALFLGAALLVGVGFVASAGVPGAGGATTHSVLGIIWGD